MKQGKKQSGKDSRFGTDVKVNSFRAVICCKAPCKPSTSLHLSIDNFSRQLRLQKPANTVNLWQSQTFNFIRKCNPLSHHSMLLHLQIDNSCIELRLIISVGSTSSLESLCKCSLFKEVRFCSIPSGKNVNYSLSSIHRDSRLLSLWIQLSNSCLHFPSILLRSLIEGRLANPTIQDIE